MDLRALGVKGVELGSNKSAGVEESVRAGGPNFAIVKKKFGEHALPGNLKPEAE